MRHIYSLFLENHIRLFQHQWRTKRWGKEPALHLFCSFQSFRAQMVVSDSYGRARCLTTVEYSQGIVLAGRFCAPAPGSIDCCLPCPMTGWVYSDSESFSDG